MWTIPGRTDAAFCDGITRRDFLRVGGLAMGGLSLPQLLAAEARAGAGRSHKAIIMIFLAGGPPHQDMVDLKPEAPEGIRGEFKPIATNVPGIDICEHMPRLARLMDRMSIIRSIVGARDEHASDQCLCGYPESLSKVQGGRPALGSVLSYLQGPTDPAVPPFVGLAPRMTFMGWADPGDPGYLGLAHAPFTPNRAESVDAEAQGLTLDRLGDRRALLAALDDYRRRLDASRAIEGMDAFNRSAFEILTSRKLLDALDVTKEDPRLRERYGIGDMTPVDDGGPCCNDHFLVARRLVEAGARCVTLAFGRWDYHNNNFGQCRERLPKLDRALSALIEDLHARGLDRDVTVICWGEFGRTPRVNGQAGRDHWPKVSMAMLAGGGMRHGQVIGSTDRHAAEARERPITFQNVFATLYQRLGIDPSTAVPDRAGRPMYLLQETEPIPELI